MEVHDTVCNPLSIISPGSLPGRLVVFIDQFSRGLVLSPAQVCFTAAAEEF
jgi:hypothetical protein